MPSPRHHHNGPKSQPVKRRFNSAVALSADHGHVNQGGGLVKWQPPPAKRVPSDLTSRAAVSTTLTGLLGQCRANDAAAALIPWFCDALPSPRSRRDYYRDLQAFFGHLADIGVHPYHVTGDHVRLYKEAMIQAGSRPASVARALSVVRGTYEQFGKKGLVPWNVVGDIQAVSAPRVTKNTTPMIGEEDACRMLHAPDIETPMGCRDHAMLFTYFKTACRSSAIASARVEDLERSDTEWFLQVTEKGKKERRLPLLEAAPAVLRWVEISGIGLDAGDTPLFPALDRDKQTPTKRHLSGRQTLKIVKKYAKMVGLNVDPQHHRGICTHSLRKTSAVNALRHGAHVHQVQQWLGHADIRTTQEYITYKEDDAEAAARRCQIR